MNEGIFVESLTGKEKIQRIRKRTSYIIPAGKRHQIIHGKDKNQSDIGIAFSKNGREDFRCYDYEEVYVKFNGPYAYGAFEPVRSLGFVVDLSRLV